MVTKYPRAFVDGRWIDARYSQHPNYTHGRDVVSNRKPKYPPAPTKAIGRYSWHKLQEWIPVQIEQGNPIGRKELMQAFNKKETTIAARNWLLIIYHAYPNRFEWEDDPNYKGKRGRKVMRLRIK